MKHSWRWLGRQENLQHQRGTGKGWTRPEFKEMEINRELQSNSLETVFWIFLTKGQREGGREGGEKRQGERERDRERRGAGRGGGREGVGGEGWEGAGTGGGSWGTDI